MTTLERINSIAREQFWVKQPVTAETHLTDMEMDSLDLVEFVMEVEDVFAIEIADAVAASWVTVGDVVGFVEKSVDDCLRSPIA